jgi:hypothetical protein
MMSFNLKQERAVRCGQVRLIRRLGFHPRKWLASAVIGLLVSANCTAARAVVVTIDASKYGAASASGGPDQPNVQPGVVLTNIYSPKDQLTLAAGTYSITNAATSGYYSAWNFQGYPTTPNWVWSFIIADDATSTVIDDGWVSGVQSTQAAMAALTGTTTHEGLTQLPATSTASFTDTLVLSHSTTLDFLIDDYYLPDNGGGIALDIEPVPEPATFALAALGAIALLAARRRFFRVIPVSPNSASACSWLNQRPSPARRYRRFARCSSSWTASNCRRRPFPN